MGGQGEVEPGAAGEEVPQQDVQGGRGRRGVLRQAEDEVLPALRGGEQGRLAVVPVRELVWRGNTSVSACEHNEQYTNLERKCVIQPNLNEYLKLVFSEMAPDMDNGDSF